MTQFRIQNLTVLGLTLALTAGAALSASNDGKLSPQTETLCSDAWYRSIEKKVPTGDGQEHGPDLGSDEWKSVVEFKLGIRGQPDVPERDSQNWCRHVDQIVRNHHASATGSGNSDRAAKAAGPSFACDKVEAGSIEAMICGDAELSALDLKLSGVYAAASSKATNERPPRLKAEQSGWIKGRNDCWKSGDRHGCVRDEYQRRITELQASYRLAPGKGPVRFLCDGSPINEVVATFFQTDPPTLIAEHGDSVSLMYLQPSGSGARYQGRNETFWEHHGEASITWGHGAPEMRCKKAPWEVFSRPITGFNPQLLEPKAIMNIILNWHGGKRGSVTFEGMKAQPATFSTLEGNTQFVFEGKTYFYTSDPGAAEMEVKHFKGQ